MARVFLAWLAFLVAASWTGVALAELGTFRWQVAVLAGLVAAAATAIATRSDRSNVSRRDAVVPLFAAALAVTLLPAVDTTLFSQDASIHVASGRWLGRTGSLTMEDPALATVPIEVRAGLYEMAAIGLTRVSQSRLPGGLVISDVRESTVYPSFAHLLAVWIAIADGVAGDRGVSALGPVFAVTAWWGIGLVALLTGGVASALATVALLASWLPEHWFARFLMPEILAQALVWGGVAAARLAAASAGDARAPGPGGSRWVAGFLCGASLGVAGFARLEQLVIFVPSLLIARGLLLSRSRVLPRGAIVPFTLAAAHALAHLVAIPTDYGKRISRVLVDVTAVSWDVLGATPGRVLGSLLVIAGSLVAAGLLLRRRRPGLFTRSIALASGILVFAAILRGGLPSSVPGVRWLTWYVPWPAWIAAALGILPWAQPSGLGLALFLEAIDQIANPRVTEEHVWAARRLVTVALPMAALAAGWAIGRRDAPRSFRASALGAALVGLAVVVGGVRLAPLAWSPIQRDATAFVRSIDAALPAGSPVLVAKSLDWLHLAPTLWLEGGHDVLVARESPRFPEALAWWLERHSDREAFALGGAVTSGRERAAVDSAASLPQLPAGWVAVPVRTFEWRAAVLERTTDRAPRALVEHDATVELFRLRPPTGRRSTSSNGER